MTQHRKAIKLGPSREFDTTEYSAKRLLLLQSSYGEFDFSGLESDDENVSDKESVSADEETIISKSIDCEDE